MAFTPPKTFPQEYITEDGRRAIILAEGCGLYPYVGQVISRNGAVSTKAWSKSGYFTHGFGTDLHDIPSKNTPHMVSVLVPITAIQGWAA